MEEIVRPATGEHVLGSDSHVSARAPTCEHGGNVEYYQCVQCGKYFADENLEEELQEDEVFLDALTETGHHADLVPFVGQDSNEPLYYYCPVCGEKYADQNGTIPYEGT
jgi:DNA-directed RNA polymerase subunit RPC12/RpoP